MDWEVLPTLCTSSLQKNLTHQDTRHHHLVYMILPCVLSGWRFCFVYVWQITSVIYSSWQHWWIIPCWIMCIMFVSTGVLFYDCNNVYFPVWRIGNHLFRPFSKIVARVQYFERKYNPETISQCEGCFHNSDCEDWFGLWHHAVWSAVYIFRATLCSQQCNPSVFLTPVPSWILYLRGYRQRNIVRLSL